MSKYDVNNHFIDPFLKILPTLDVHGETSDTVIFLVKDLIGDAVKMGNEKIAIIHGRHGTILKSAIHNYLKTDKRVKRFYLYNYNNGITIIELAPRVVML